MLKTPTVHNKKGDGVDNNLIDHSIRSFNFPSPTFPKKPLDKNPLTALPGFLTMSAANRRRFLLENIPPMLLVCIE